MSISDEKSEQIISDVKRPLSDIDRILDFWFGEIQDEMPVEPRQKLWFGGGDALDKQIKETFEPLLLNASEGEYRHWRHSPRGSLALIILLDQFPLNMYRKSANAFRFESQAIATCKKGLEQKHDKSLSLCERSFFYMPLQHSEKLDDHELSQALYQNMHDTAPSEHQEFTGNVLKFALEHQETIVRFGRYPYRNTVLGRTNSPEEEAYLANNPKRYGQ